MVMIMVTMMIVEKYLGQIRSEQPVPVQPDEHWQVYVGFPAH